MATPNVVVSSAGVFHAYHLARAAEQAGYLRRFITSIYDRREVGIDRDRVVQIRLAGLMSAALARVPVDSVRPVSYYLTDNLYDWLARKYVCDADIFHVFNHQGLYSIRKAKRHGILSVVERSSAHPVIQFNLIAAEYARFGLRYPRSYSWLLDKHLAEYEEADYVMVASEFVRRTMVRAGVPDHKLRRVHLGFDPGSFFSGQKQDTVFRVIYAGIQSIRKGTFYLLEAFRKLGLPNAELVLIGEQWPEMKSIAVRFAGTYRHVKYLSRSELAAWFRQGSVFVMPSIEDGFGMVVYEAAACGLPVIWTTRVGAALRDGIDGYEVSAGDPDALAEKLLSLYEHESMRRQMGQSAHDYVQQFTWQNYYHEVVAHYDEMLANRS